MVESAYQERMQSPRQIDDEEGNLLVSLGDWLTYEDAERYGLMTTEEVAEPARQRALEAQAAQDAEEARTGRISEDRGE